MLVNLNINIAQYNFVTWPTFHELTYACEKSKKLDPHEKTSFTSCINQNIYFVSDKS